MPGEIIKLLVGNSDDCPGAPKQCGECVAKRICLDIPEPEKVIANNHRVQTDQYELAQLSGGPSGQVDHC